MLPPLCLLIDNQASMLLDFLSNGGLGAIYTPRPEGTVLQTAWLTHAGQPKVVEVLGNAPSLPHCKCGVLLLSLHPQKVSAEEPALRFLQWPEYWTHAESGRSSRCCPELARIWSSRRVLTPDL